MDVKADVPSLKHQLKFINSTAIHPAMVAGYGAGKSEGGLRRGMKLKTFPQHKLGVYAPTYGLLRDIWHDKFESFLNYYNIPHNLNKTDNILYIQGYGLVYFRSMDKPESIIGYDHHDAIIDEIDTMKKAKADKAWKRIIARNRSIKPNKAPNTVGAMTTPEGFGFTYEKWVKNKLSRCELIKATTYDNPFLPEDYIPTLKESYDEKLLEAYLNGNFVNLLQGQVYYAFDSDKHIKTGEIPIDPTLPLCLTVDFNVNPCIWNIVQFRTRYDIRVIKEVKANNTNTFDMCVRVKKALPDFCKHMDLVIYGDAAGEHRSTQSTETDYTIMHREFTAHFRTVSYKVPNANPPVKTRTLCVNNVLSKNSVKLSKSVVELAEDFIQVVYTDKGEVDKSDMKRTHSSDGFGYFASVEAPIIHKREYMEVRQR